MTKFDHVNYKPYEFLLPSGEWVERLVCDTGHRETVMKILGATQFRAVEPGNELEELS